MNIQLRPVFLDHFLVLGHFGGPAIARPIRSGAIAEADIDVLVVCDFITFLGDVVDDEDEGKLRIFEGPSRVHCARMQKSVSGACCEHSGLCSLHDLEQTSYFFLNAQIFMILGFGGVGIKRIGVGGGHVLVVVR